MLFLLLSFHSHCQRRREKVWQMKGVSVASGVVTSTQRRLGSDRRHRCSIEHFNARITAKLHREAPGISQTGVAIRFHLKAPADEQQLATAAPCSQDDWITHVLDAKPEGYQPRAQTLLCAMADTESQPTYESLRNSLTGGNCQLALSAGECLSQDQACWVACDHSSSQHSYHRHTSGMIESHGVAVRLCTTATPFVQALDSVTATFWQVLSLDVFSTAAALAICTSCRRPSHHSKHCLVVCSSRCIRSTFGYPLPLTLGGPLGPGRSEGGRP
jgi:hypothetical protein